jgi:hypothetical protein
MNILLSSFNENYSGSEDFYGSPQYKISLISIGQADRKNLLGAFW